MQHTPNTFYDLDHRGLSKLNRRCDLCLCKIDEKRVQLFWAFFVGRIFPLKRINDEASVFMGQNKSTLFILFHFIQYIFITIFSYYYESWFILPASQIWVRFLNPDQQLSFKADFILKETQIVDRSNARFYLNVGHFLKIYLWINSTFQTRRICSSFKCIRNTFYINFMQFRKAFSDLFCWTRRRDDDKWK